MRASILTFRRIRRSRPFPAPSKSVVGIISVLDGTSRPNAQNALDLFSMLPPSATQASAAIALVHAGAVIFALEGLVCCGLLSRAELGLAGGGVCPLQTIAGVSISRKMGTTCSGNP
jgi:hypothetical protein